MPSRRNEPIDVEPPHDLLSRLARLAAAGDAERRRFERELHDGAQQDLIALAVNLQLVRRLVDTDPEGAKKLLEELGRDIHEALDDIILMDIRLPDADGTELAKQLKGDPRTASIPIVAVTAFAMKGDREWFLAAGFDGYVEKPIDVGEFAGQVRSYCRSTQ